MWIDFLFVLATVTTAHAYKLGDIKHFIVLFYENRAFDHIFGCATKELPGIDGVTAGMGNWVDPNDHSKGFVTVECGKAQYVCAHNEVHSFPGTTKQIFGPGVTDGASSPYPNMTMGGFANLSKTAMHAFAPEQLPIKIKLAQEFALFNNFYSAMPGPSQPNHMFAQSGTSCGITETGTVFDQCGGVLPLFPQKTIYDSLLHAGHEFAVYYNGSITEGGIPGDIYMSGLLKHIATRAKTYDQKGGFFDAAATGTLPEFSWMLPRNGGSHPNDDHPCHDMALGEELLKSVYEALRAGPAWNDTALFVVYDDHGGYFDHVPPPNVYAPPPNTACDKKNTGCPDKFAFDRLGPRLANILISPRVPKSAVIRDPTGPTNTSKYDLASIPATVKNLFGLPEFLTERDAWSGSFHEIMLGEPRTDTPLHLPEAPAPTLDVPTQHGCGPPEDATRRQKRHHALLDKILSHNDLAKEVIEEVVDEVVDKFIGVQQKKRTVVNKEDKRESSSSDDDGDDDEEENDDEGGKIPLLGENSFIVTKGFVAMKEAISKKMQILIKKLSEGSLNIPADEL